MLTDFLFHPSTILGALHVVLVVGISMRVIMRRPNTGVALAWLFLVAAIPFLGALIYFLLGEKRISRARARQIKERRADYAKLVEMGIERGRTDVPWERHPVEARGMDRLGTKMVGFPTVTGSTGKRSGYQRFLENTFRLVSPIL